MGDQVDIGRRREMMRENPFERLCALAGVDATYQDIKDEQHIVPDDTRRAMLAAMGLAGDPAKVLKRVEDQLWQRVLAPVTAIVEADPGFDLILHLPAAAEASPLHWQIVTESGTRCGGPLLLGKPQKSRKIGGSVWRRHAVRIDALLPLGYHDLAIHSADGSLLGAPTCLIVAPERCYAPPAIDGDGRVWGPGVQLYGLRSHGNWGMGDFGDLHKLVEIAAHQRADVVGLNPLHALFADDPNRNSPYSPSSRRFLNPLYISIEEIPEFADCESARTRVADPALRAEIARARETDLVDYVRVANAKREVLRQLWQCFEVQHLAIDSARAQSFRDFVAGGGEALRRHALHEALREHFHGDGARPVSWPAWPEAYRDGSSAALATFAAEHASDLAYHQYLQWLATDQLRRCGSRSCELGLGIGLYFDLAVGVADDGSEAWSNPDHYADGVRLGAPPDDFSPSGQDWGLLPFNPRALREAAYEPFIACLRAAMQEGGALRIDHVMGLTRQFWIPLGRGAKRGGYVRFPVDELLAVVALESVRNQCAVIGEDLGTVPNGLRRELARRNLMSYRPLWFQRARDGGFCPPAQYPQEALVAGSTHDLPTLTGFWLGHDLDTRAALGLFPNNAERENQFVGRAQDRARLLLALKREALLPDGIALHPVAVPELTPELAAAIHRFLARCPSRILLMQPEDALGVVDQVNLPGTVHEHPNWRRKLPIELEQWRGEPRLTAVSHAIRVERPPADHLSEPLLDANTLVSAPRATYRLQFNRNFTFAQATALIPYLAELGVSHCYCSPFLCARPGSNHGYDVTDHDAFNPEIGSSEDFERFAATARSHGLSIMVDVVPNHMGVMGSDNRWWLDVLENGPASHYASYFDIDWEPAKEELRGKVLLPILGDHYGEILVRGEIRLVFDAERGEVSLYYWQHRLPLDPAEYPRILATESAGDAVPPEFHSLATAFRHLPPRTETDPVRVDERTRDATIHKRRLARMAERVPAVAAHIDARIAYLNGVPGDAASFDALHEVISAQAYRLAFWRVAADDINYRRFFDINDLAALRMENEEVFEATHRRILELVARNQATALRIDHPDGLLDPAAYFRRLQRAAAGARRINPPPSAAIYLTIEKILADHEPLREDWPVHGTTGYRFANVVNGLFVDTSNARKMSRIYADFVGYEADFDEIVYQAKRLIMKTSLASELAVLATELARIAGMSRYTCDYTLNALRDALREVTACFPVYRTYVTEAELTLSDRRHIDWAVARAKKRSLAADISVFDFLHGVLTQDIMHNKPADYAHRVTRFACRFQQFSAPVMAKGTEDTAFYRYNRLVALNEVGGDPRTFGFTPSAFHAANRDRARRWPRTMLATSTHDSKRSEDTRARISVISEMPGAWKLAVRRWRRINRSRKTQLDGLPAPDSNDEYLLYQTLLGSFPLEPLDDAALQEYAERIERYMLKAVREAKVNSSWINANAAYEAALLAFIRALLAPGTRNLFLADFVPAIRQVCRIGLYNSLGQLLAKLTVPGVPDIYQGSELWQFRLVDPDNRQPVDYAVRGDLLAQFARRLAGGPEAHAQLASELFANLDDGRLKLYLTWRTLRLRAQHEALFAEGDYVPLDSAGPRAEQICAFARTHGKQLSVSAFGRMYARFDASAAHPVGAVWSGSRIALPAGPQTWHDVYTGRRLLPTVEGDRRWLAADDVFAILPIALLVET